MTEGKPEHFGEVKNIQRLIAFLGVFFLLLSQFLVFSQEEMVDTALPPYTWLGIFGVLILVSSQLIRPTPFWQRLALLPIFKERVFWIFVASLLSLLAAGATAFFMIYTRVNYIPVVTVWLLGAASYVYAFAKGDEPFQPVAVVNWFKTHRTELLSVLAVMFFAAVIRFYELGNLPRVLDGDEGKVGLAALTTYNGDLTNPFALWENFGALYLQLINFGMRLFGVNSFSLRLMPALGGILAVPAVYLLARRVGGQRIALVAAILIAFSHSHLHFSRIVSVAYIQDTWLIPLELYLLISGLEKRVSWRTALGGVLLAAHYSVYLTSQIITGLALIFMLITFLFYRDWFKQRLEQAFAFWGGFLIFILPSAVYIYSRPLEFMNRVSNSGTFQSGWLEIAMQETGQSVFQILSGRVVHVFLSLFYFPAFEFYGSPVPMMSMISSVMFFAGLGIALWRIRNPIYLLLNGYFWGATVAIGLFATPPSADSYRMLMALPAAMILASLGLELILDMMGLGWKARHPAYAVTVSAILASLIIFNLWTYYSDFTGRCRFTESLAGRFASYLGAHVSGIDNEQRIYLLSDEFYFHGSHASTLFLSESRPVTNFPDPVDTLDVISGETIIASPSRIMELEEWARAHPGGQLHYEYDCDTTILFSYRVP